MSNGLKVGMLAVIAVFLGVIAYKLYSSDSVSEEISRPMETQTNATAANNQTATNAAIGDAASMNQQKTQGEEVSSSSSLPASSISFEEYEWDFGTINEGDKVEHIFKFTNTGKEPLILENCKGSCGCTVPQCPKEPIPPGGKGEIKVAFNSQGKTNAQTKKVTVTANTVPTQTVLTIKAQVTPAAK